MFCLYLNKHMFSIKFLSSENFTRENILINNKFKMFLTEIDECFCIDFLLANFEILWFKKLLRFYVLL